MCIREVDASLMRIFEERVFRSRSVNNKAMKVKSNNGGFTLLEVLVAMIILTVVCVPLLRSFATSAQTNAKAKIQMKSTTAAENVMEKIKTMSQEELEDMTTLYTASGSLNDKITYTIDDNDVLKADLPTGYYATVELDANGASGDEAYPNANSLNLSDFNPISVRDCAVYTMADDFDHNAYNTILARNSARYAAHPATTVQWNEDDCKSKLTRTMTIITEDAGSYVDDDGETQKLVRVKLKIDYHVSESNVVASTDRDYTATEAYLFDNTSSHQKLSGIYLFYYPRYTAASSGNKEVLNVKNNAGVSTDLYVVAMNGGTDYSTVAKDTYLLTGKGLSMVISEPALDADGKGKLTLRTNLLSRNSVTTFRTPYSTNDNNDYRLGFSLTYKPGTDNYTANQTTDPNPADYALLNGAIKGLTVSDIDGKTLNSSLSRVRIYRVRVKVFEPGADPEVDLPVSYMEGTKLNHG